MTPDEVKAAWAAEINSHEKFAEVVQRTRAHIGRTWQGWPAYLPQRDGTHLMSLSHEDNDVWPLQRDMIREAVGFYPEATSVIKWLRTMQSNTGLAQMFPHVSPIDRAQIAFTPDAQQGKADRKQRMSVGRFLRKFLLWVPDSEIQRLDQQHRSELDTEFELAETIQAIREVYVGMDGDTGCMRYKEAHFGHTDYHPSAAYASPGMGVAYTRDHTGKVKSRSVVWTNPEDASDKRYVRIYGDPILKKKLEANGFMLRGLVGAKLRILHDSSFQTNGSLNTMVMPWIDPAGGIHARNVDRSFDSEFAIRYTGEEFITLVSEEQKERYRNAGIYCANVQSQSGHVDVPEVDPRTFSYVCAITGAQTNRMDVGTTMWLDSEGTVRQARTSAVSACSDAAWMHIQREGRLQRIYSAMQTREKFSIPGHGSYFNDEATREAAGLCALDKAFYADSERYHSRRECVFMTGPDDEHRYIKKDDALMLYSEEGDRFVHIDMVKALKSEGCVPVAVYAGMRGLAHKDHPQLVVTRGGKRVIKARHDVTKLYDGSWEYTRNVVTMSVAGISLSISKNEDKRAITITKEMARERFDVIFGFEPEHRKTRMLQAFQRGFEGGPVYMRSGDSIIACDYYNKPSDLWPMVDAANGIITMQDDAEWTQRTLGYQKVNAYPWARSVIAIWEAMKEYDKEHEMMLAEANAVEAAPTTQAVIEHLNTLADSDMDRLIAEVDDTLATAVVRRWPRLQAAGMLTPQAERPMAPVVAAALDQMEAEMGPQLPTLVDENGALVPVQVPVHFTPHMDVPIAHPDRIAELSMSEAEDARNRQAVADDALLRELQSVGLAPIVIDENTVFPEPSQS